MISQRGLLVCVMGRSVAGKSSVIELACELLRSLGVAAAYVTDHEIVERTLLRPKRADGWKEEVPESDRGFRRDLPDRRPDHFPGAYPSLFGPYIIGALFTEVVAAPLLVYFAGVVWKGLSEG